MGNRSPRLRGRGRRPDGAEPRHRPATGAARRGRGPARPVARRDTARARAPLHTGATTAEELVQRRLPLWHDSRRRQLDARARRKGAALPADRAARHRPPALHRHRRVLRMSRNTGRPVGALLGAIGLAAALAGCAASAMRGGEGTDNPNLDRPAMSVTLDRDDITYLVADYLKSLEASPFWQDTIKNAPQ